MLNLFTTAFVIRADYVVIIPDRIVPRYANASQTTITRQAVLRSPSYQVPEVYPLPLPWVWGSIAACYASGIQVVSYNSSAGPPHVPMNSRIVHLGIALMITKSHLTM